MMLYSVLQHTSHSAESLHEIFCRSASGSDASLCEEEEIPVATDGDQAETTETDDADSDSLTSVSEEEFCEGETRMIPSFCFTLYSHDTDDNNFLGRCFK